MFSLNRFLKQVVIIITHVLCISFIPAYLSCTRYDKKDRNSTVGIEGRCDIKTIDYEIDVHLNMIQIY